MFAPNSKCCVSDNPKHLCSECRALLRRHSPAANVEPELDYTGQCAGGSGRPDLVYMDLPCERDAGKPTDPTKTTAEPRHVGRDGVELVYPSFPGDDRAPPRR